MSLGQRGAAAADIDADGIVQGGRFVASARLDAGWRSWREGPAEISVAADSPDVEQLLRLALGTGGEPQRARTARRGQLNLKAQGIPNRGMLAAAELQSAGLVLSYDGPLKLEKDVPTAIDGEVRITADDVAEALDLAGIPLGGAEAVPIDGVLTVTARDNVLSIKPRELVVGSRKVAGSLIVAQRSGRPSTVTANLELGEVTLAELLTPLLERRSQAASNAGADVSARMTQVASSGGQNADAGPWADASFDLQPLDRLDGTVEVQFKRLRIKDGLGLGDGRLVARLEPGRVAVETLTGTALGGRVSGSASFARVKGGVDGKVALRLVELQPGLFAAEGSALRTGARPLSITLEAAGRAQSPRGLVAAMRGKGIVDVARLDVPGVSPAVVAAQAAAFVSGKLGTDKLEADKSEPGEGVLTRALTAAGERGVATVPAGKYEIEVGDGAMRVRPITIEGAGGRTAIDTTLDLDALRFDSEWRIDVAADTVRGKSPPPQQPGAAVTSGAIAVGVRGLCRRSRRGCGERAAGLGGRARTRAAGAADGVRSRRVGAAAARGRTPPRDGTRTAAGGGGGAGTSRCRSRRRRPALGEWRGRGRAAAAAAGPSAGGRAAAQRRDFASAAAAEAGAAGVAGRRGLALVIAELMEARSYVGGGIGPPLRVR